MRTFLRLLGFLRPYRAGVIASGLLAAAAMVFTVLIPWLTGRAIDDIRRGDEPGLEALAWAVVGAAVLRLGLTVAKMRANPVQRITHECEVTDGQGMRVLPRKLPVALPKTPFSGYYGLISRAPERRPPGKQETED